MASVMAAASNSVAMDVEAEPELIFEFIGELFWLAVGCAVIHFVAKLGWIPDLSPGSRKKPKHVADAKRRPVAEKVAVPVEEQREVRDEGKVPMGAIASQVVECLRVEDVDGATRLEELARKQGEPVSFAVIEPLIKLFAKTDASRASKLFRDLQKHGFYASEGFCGSLMARSGEARNIAFAEEVAAYLRSRSMMTLATFKTLMKVYATNGMYDKACDLYEEIRSAGVEPDQVMYGCLAKFAAKCGRTEMAQQLHAARASQGGDVQSYMCGMRSAADVESVLSILRQAEASQKSRVDVAMYNCAVDACVRLGRMDCATKLATEVASRGIANGVTHNTLIKGHCASGDRAAARRVLAEMSQGGIAPDSASYNSILSVAVESGNGEVWEILREMERSNIPLDHYTVSIMMKVAKRARTAEEASRALAVLDRAGVPICSDEVLLNTALDACIVRRDFQRLSTITRSFSSSPSLRPSVHTYGLLIKAFGMLKQHGRCQELWSEMTDRRGITPSSIALSCMLDALCGAAQVEEAVSLLKTWKGKVPANTVMYATLIKGFVSVGDAGRAVDMHRDLKADGLEMNLVAYTCLIDAHVRTGRMDRAEAIFSEMQEVGCRPNVITYSTLAKGYCARGELDEAMRLFSSMLRSGLTADVVLFNTLLDGCTNHGRFELADKLLEDMAESGVEPSNFTLSIIVKLWGKRRRLDEAFAAVRARHGQRRPCLDPQVGACLISACFHNNSISRAMEAVVEIKTWPGCSDLDGSIYSALVTGLVRHGDLRRAVAYATEACEASMKSQGAMKPMSAECLKLLFKALQQQGLALELGTPLAHKLRLTGAAVPTLPGAEDGDRLEPARRRAPAPRQQAWGRRDR